MDVNKTAFIFFSILKDVDPRSENTVSSDRTAVSTELKGCGKKWKLSDLRLCQNLLGGTERIHEVRIVSFPPEIRTRNFRNVTARASCLVVYYLKIHTNIAVTNLAPWFDARSKKNVATNVRPVVLLAPVALMLLS
jgi:hypothetical protein